MTEGDRAVVRVALLNEHMTVEAAHLRDGEDADAAEAARMYRQDLALGDVAAQITVGIALQAVERDLACCKIGLERAAGKIRLRACRFEQTVLNELVLDRAVSAELAGGRVAAVEAHEGIRQGILELALDLSLKQAGRDRVIDVQQRHGIVRNARADVLRQRAVDIDLAGHGDAARGQTGIDIARLEAELLREGRPALVGKRDILARALVALGPVEQRQLKLRHAFEHIGVISALAHFLLHILTNGGNTRIARMGLVGNEQIQLGVLLDLHAQLVQALDGRVAGEEVLRTRAEGDDLQILHADNGTGNGDKVRDHLRDILRRADRILGDIALQMAHAEVIRTVQHTAVRIAAAVDQVAVALGGSHEHTRAVKISGNERFRRLRAEVAKEDDKGVAACRVDVGNGLQHIVLVFDGHGAFVHAALTSLGDVRAAHFGERSGEAVAGNGDEAELDIGDVFKHDTVPP